MPRSRYGHRKEKTHLASRLRSTLRSPLTISTLNVELFRTEVLRKFRDSSWSRVQNTGVLVLESRQIDACRGSARRSMIVMVRRERRDVGTRPLFVAVGAADNVTGKVPGQAHRSPANDPRVIQRGQCASASSTHPIQWPGQSCQSWSWQRELQCPTEYYLSTRVLASMYNG